MRKVWIFVALVALAMGAMLLMARSGRGEWTTSSSQALEALEEGHAALMKHYDADAHRHFWRALELDPEFVAARLALMGTTHDKKELAEHAAALEAADLSRLTAREQFLVRYRLARFNGDDKQAKQILKAYLDVYPDDPWGLDAYAEIFWKNQQLDKAAEVYRKVLAADPNWVAAQNRLGYVAMAQGRFDEAEELFRTYAYIAPDQANPHDSMGELLIVLGRYDEAREQLERALEIKPDFCESYRHLMEVEVLDSRLDEVPPLVERAKRAGCTGEWIDVAPCDVAYWRDYLARDYDGPWSEERAGCLAEYKMHFLIHRMAALSGRTEVALEIEAKVEEYLEKEGGGASGDYLGAVLAHFQGVRLLASGEPQAAAEKLARADELFLYWGQDRSIFKLFNRLNLACAYELAGERRRAKELLGEVAEVNPPFASFYGYLLESFSA